MTHQRFIEIALTVPLMTATMLMLLASEVQARILRRLDLPGVWEQIL